MSTPWKLVNAAGTQSILCSKLPGLKRFYKLLADAVRPDARKLIDEDHDGSKRAIQHRLLGIEWPPEGNRSLRRSGFFRSRMLKEKLEITAVAEMLQDIPLYIRKFPFAMGEVSKLGYLRHYIEFHFKEIYLLQ